MAVPWQVMNKMRGKIKSIVNWGSSTHGSPTDVGERAIWGDRIKIDEQLLDDRFYTFDRDSKQIVSNYKINGYHFIFDLEGNLIKHHKD